MMKTKNKKRLPGFVALFVVCLSLFILAGIVHADGPPVLTSISITTSQLARIEISPQNPTMEVGQSLVFTAQGYDQDDNPCPINDPFWEGEYGTLTPDPNDPQKCTFTANQVGNGYIVCWEGTPPQATIHGSTDITITEPESQLDRIEVSPSSVSLTIGEDRQFAAKGFDQNGNEIPITPQWSTDGGTIDQTGKYTATEVGDFTVTASVQGSSVTGTASVHVTQPSGQLAKIVVSPRRAILYPGKSKQFTAKGYDNNGNEVPITPIWRATGGTITQQGLYKAGFRDGYYIVTARAKGSLVTGIAYVKIRHRLSRIELTPHKVTLPPRGKQQFTAVGYDDNGNVVPFSPKWSTTYGKITQQGLYKAPVIPGYAIVSVKAKGTWISAYAYVKIYQKLAKIVVTPSLAKLKRNKTIQFKATGYDKNGNEVPFIPKWHVTGGNITSTGLYTAPSRRGYYFLTVRAKNTYIWGFARIIVR